MLNLNHQHRKVYEQIAKEKAAHQPDANSTPAANGHTSSPLLPKSSRPVGVEAGLLTRMQGTDLMKYLGFVNLTEHSVEIRRYYLLGCAYHYNAHSVRQIVKKLDDPPPEFLADDLAVRVRKTIDVSKNDLFVTITRLEKLLNASLVIRLGEGLPFAGLNENGEAFWKMVAEYLRENW